MGQILVIDGSRIFKPGQPQQEESVSYLRSLAEMCEWFCGTNYRLKSGLPADQHKIQIDELWVDITYPKLRREFMLEIETKHWGEFELPRRVTRIFLYGDSALDNKLSTSLKMYQRILTRNYNLTVTIVNLEDHFLEA